MHKIKTWGIPIIVSEREDKMNIRKIFAVAIAVFCLASVSFADVPAPLALSQRAIGGGQLNQYTPGVEGGIGLNNIGLLVKTWGKVTFVDDTNKIFYINDGSNLNDDSGNVGLRVSYDNLATGNTINAPALNSYVSVVGISSTFADSSNKIRPNLKPRSQTDIQIISAESL